MRADNPDLALHDDMIFGGFDATLDVKIYSGDLKKNKPMWVVTNIVTRSGLNVGLGLGRSQLLQQNQYFLSSRSSIIYRNNRVRL